MPRVTAATRPAALIVMLALLLAVAGTVATGPIQVASAAPQILYVDGKHGNDANSGLSWSEAFKTIYEAARSIPRYTAGAGWHVVVRGYTDYLYRGRPIPGGWNAYWRIFWRTPWSTEV